MISLIFLFFFDLIEFDVKKYRIDILKPARDPVKIIIKIIRKFSFWFLPNISLYIVTITAYIANEPGSSKMPEGLIRSPIVDNENVVKYNFDTLYTTCNSSCGSPPAKEYKTPTIPPISNSNKKNVNILRTRGFIINTESLYPIKIENARTNAMNNWELAPEITEPKKPVVIKKITKPGVIMGIPVPKIRKIKKSKTGTLIKKIVLSFAPTIL
jgi:hypothetical protein